MKKKVKWECHTKGHQTLEGLPDNKTLIMGKLYQGRICRFCSCVYYELLGEASPIVAPKIILSDQ